MTAERNQNKFMTDKLKQIIQDEVVKLPKEIQEAISAHDWTKIAEEIGKKFLLTESEINDFQTETLLVLVGLESTESYAKNIEHNVGTSESEAGKIADEALGRIFNPILNTLEENMRKNLRNKNPSPEQTLNFILSGGDYSTFLGRTDATNRSSATTENQKVVGASNILDMKNKLLE